MFLFMCAVIFSALTLVAAITILVTIDEGDARLASLASFLFMLFVVMSFYSWTKSFAELAESRASKVEIVEKNP